MAPQMSLVQRIAQQAMLAFRSANGGPLRPSHVETLRQMMDLLTPDQLRVPASVDQFPALVTYAHIFDCPEFHMGVFLVKAGGQIPLHDHPAMTVFSKVLFGKLESRSFDWIETGIPPSVLPKWLFHHAPTSKLACLAFQQTFDAHARTHVLYPNSNGNIHSIRALTNTAFIDILSPPYDADEGRDCSYFQEVPLEERMEDAKTVFATLDPQFREQVRSKELKWLVKAPTPAEFFVDDTRYNGPPVVIPREI
eukprot:Opistho-2@21215